jgi:hypothetical protein
MADTGAMQDELKERPLYQMPAIIARNERIVQKKFWTVLLHRAGKIPFAEELGAAYYCVMDPICEGDFGYRYEGAGNAGARRGKGHQGQAQIAHHRPGMSR